MNIFWDRVFEYWKERRYGFIFVSTLMLFFGALALGGICYAALVRFELLQYLPMALPGVALVLSALIWRGVRLARRRRSDRYKSLQLSRDELSKARSKLMTKPTFKRT